MRTSAWGVLAVVAAVKLAVAWRWGLLADEAYHYVWSLAPAFGYYDQPPLVAWVLAGERWVGEAPVVLRAVPIGGWIAAMAWLAPFARDRRAWWLWSAGLPPLALLTNLAVPDALLLSCWGLGLGCALRGGRMWVAAGGFGGLASLAKYTGILLVPLLILAASREERRSPWPWLAGLVALAMLTPNLWWNEAHEWVTWRFVLQEGLATPPTPGLAGVATQLRDQIGFVTPLAWGLGVVGFVRAARHGDRVDRMLLATSFPLLLLFAAAAWGGRPEAHWPAPAWIGAGLLVCRVVPGPAARWAAGSAVLVTILGLVHAERPLVPLRLDPATRLGEARVLGAGTERVQRPIFTERYQEAALLTWLRGTPAHVLPGCGRRSQYDLEATPLPSLVWYLRPTTSGPPACLRARCEILHAPERIGGTDPGGRAIGPWDLFLAKGCR